MDVAELAPVPAPALPVAALRDHLRLGRGFQDEAVQDPVLEACLRAALAAIEARTGRALFRRGFRLRLPGWRDPAGQALPVAPVAAITELRFAAPDGTARTVAPDRYRLDPDAQRPMLRPAGGALPAPPRGSGIEIVFEAGFGPDWAAIPADLAQATLLLAAHYHEHRAEADARDAGVLPFGVATLIAPHRRVRLVGGAP